MGTLQKRIQHAQFTTRLFLIAGTLFFLSGYIFLYIDDIPEAVPFSIGMISIIGIIVLSLFGSSEITEGDFEPGEKIIDEEEPTGRAYLSYLDVFSPVSTEGLKYHYTLTNRRLIIQVVANALSMSAYTCDFSDIKAVEIIPVSKITGPSSKALKLRLVQGSRSQLEAGLWEKTPEGDLVLPMDEKTIETFRDHLKDEVAHAKKRKN